MWSNGEAERERERERELLVKGPLDLEEQRVAVRNKRNSFKFDALEPASLFGH